MFFDSVTKERFYVKGLDYAPDPYANDDAGGIAASDPSGTDHITNAKRDIWMKDVPYLAGLNINALRIYNVDPSFEHNLFMEEMAKVGIYVIVSATATKGPGVLRSSLPSPACYTTGLIVSAKKIAKNFAHFPNTLGLVVGNEIANGVEVEGEDGVVMGLLSIPCVKALTRDLRSWMVGCACTMRYLPLIYAATDFGRTSDIPGVGKIQIRSTISDYLTCGDDKIDVYGINIYTWCALDSSSSSKSTYQKVADTYSHYEVPVVLTEYGCNQGDFKSDYGFDEGQRTWKQVEAIFSSELSDTISGAFAYQYSMTGNNYGLLLLPNYEANQPNHKILKNYDSLADEYKKAVGSPLVGDWTSSNLCSWLPLNSTSKIESICPAAEVVQAMFTDKDILNHAQNWINVPLPPTPENAYVQCPAEFVDVETIGELNKCHGGECSCGILVPNLKCHVNPNEVFTGDQWANLFDAQCGLLSVYGGVAGKADACDLVSESGSLGNCPVYQRANYILDAWFDGVKYETECCVPFLNFTVCEKFSYCSELEADITSDCTVSWTSTTTQAEKTQFFWDLCSLIAVGSGSLNNACNIINQRYLDCGEVSKANYLLAQWLKINGGNGGFCCAQLGQPHASIASCSKPASCDSISTQISNRYGGVTCQVDWAQTPLTTVEDQDFWTTICTMFYEWGGIYNRTCLDISPGGKYGSCSNIQRANYVLDVWTNDVKSGSECCDTVSSTSECKAVDICGHVGYTSECVVDWTDVSDSLKYDFFYQLCPLIAASNGKFSVACDDLTGTGRYSDCTDEQKAHHILKTWFVDINEGVEGFCCSRLGQPTWGVDYCNSPTACQMLDINPLCHVDWDVREPTAEEKTYLFNTQCGYLNSYGGDHESTCDNIASSGSLGKCSDQQKANYILDTWTANVKAYKECCFNISSSHPTCFPVEEFNCDALMSNDKCMLSSDATEEEISKVINDQCEKFNSHTLKYQDLCTDFLSNAIYTNCSALQKANYFLGVWYQDVTSNYECCANLATGGTCLRSQSPTQSPIITTASPTTGPTNELATSFGLSFAVKGKAYFITICVVFFWLF